MAAYKRIYSAAGVWNEHWGRIKTICLWIGVAGALMIVAGGFLIHRYGVIGAVAIIVGAAFLLILATALGLHRLTAQHGQDTVASADPRVLVPYTGKQDKNVSIGFYFPRDANARGEIELDTPGHPKSVEWHIQATSHLPENVRDVLVTILVPDILIRTLVPMRGLVFDEDHTPEQMVSDRESQGSLRLTGSLPLLRGAGVVNAMAFKTSIGYAREIPVRVMLDSPETGSISYYGRIVGVDTFGAESPSTHDEFKDAIAAASVEGLSFVSKLDTQGDNPDAVADLLKQLGDWNDKTTKALSLRHERYAVKFNGHQLAFGDVVPTDPASAEELLRSKLEVLAAYEQGWPNLPPPREPS